MSEARIDLLERQVAALEHSTEIMLGEAEQADVRLQLCALMIGALATALGVPREISTRTVEAINDADEARVREALAEMIRALALRHNPAEGTG